MTTTFDMTKYLNVSNANESADAIGKLRLQIIEKGHTLKTDCQILLVATIQHWVAHGSGLPGKDGSQGAIALAFETIKGAMGNSMGQAAIQWVNDCTTGLFWNEKTKQFLTDRSEGAKRSIKEHVQNVKVGMEKGSPIYFSGNPLELFFGSLQKEIAQKPFDLAKQVQALLDKAKGNMDIPQSAIDALEIASKNVKTSLTEYALEMARKEEEKMQKEKEENAKLPSAPVETAIETKVERPRAERKIKSLAELAA